MFGNDKKSLKQITFYIKLIGYIIVINAQSSKNDNFMPSDVHSSHLVVEHLVLASSDNNQAIQNLVLQPSNLDFSEQSLGDPQSRIVTVFNNHQNRSVYLDTIVGSPGTTLDFYSSFIEDKVIPPQGNTTFNVIFLPRRHGVSNGELLIHTTFGLLKYGVSGRAVDCPYRLVPLIGLKAPYNATISPEIHLYNPHDKPIQIVEVFSSGGHFQLELPSGGNEGPQILWEIPPFCSKPVIRVRFTATNPGNYTAYIRIKITGNDAELADKILIVPIEIEIEAQAGLYSPTAFINFGTVGSKDSPSIFRLDLVNSGTKQVDINEWTVEGVHNESVSIHIENSDVDDKLNILIVEVNWSKVWSSYITGNVVINTSIEGIKQIPYKIPFVGRILNGTVKHNANITILLTNNKQLNISQPFIFTNNFNVPLAVTNLVVPEKTSHHFKITDFQPIVMKSKEEVTLFRVTFVNYSLPIGNNYSFVSDITILTNITSYVLPIISYSGQLRRIVPVYNGDDAPISMFMDGGSLDFGTIPVSTLSEAYIAFYNENPVSVPILSWKGKLPGATYYTIILLGCGKMTFDNLVFCHDLKPGEWVLFQVSVKSTVVGSYSGKFTISTKYEEITTPILFTTAMGRLALDPDSLHFKDCFPGKICSLNLSAHSTYLKTMQVEGIKVDIDGIIKYEHENSDTLPKISPNVVTDIGRLYFEPRAVCGDYCYTGSQVTIKLPQKKSSIVNYSHYTKLDKDVLAFRIKAFHKMKATLKSIPLKLSTNQIRRYDFMAIIDFIWPKLVMEKIVFPTAQVDHESVKFISVTNPSDQMLVTQYFLHDTQIHGYDMDLPPEVNDHCPKCILSNEKVFSFHTFLSFSSTLENYFDHIQPKETNKVAIRFSANKPGTYSTLLFIRNNLTILEAVWITAKAVLPQFKFGNRKPGSQTPLLFEMTEKHLRDCERRSNGEAVMVSALRTFTARNSGEVPIMISSIRIGSKNCEGYGFKVLNCSAFELAPNGSKKIEIAFTPDFTLARVTRPLELETNMGFSVNYTLLSTIPPQALGPCGKALLRPSWELFIKDISCAILVVALICVIIASFLERDKILKDHIQYMSREKGPLQPPLDLRKIGLKNPFSIEETQSSQQQTVSMNNISTSSSNGKSSFMSFNSRKKVSKKSASSDNSSSINNRKSWTSEIDHCKSQAIDPLRSPKSVTIPNTSVNSTQVTPPKSDSKNQKRSTTPPNSTVTPESQPKRDTNKKEKESVATVQSFSPSPDSSPVSNDQSSIGQKSYVSISSITPIMKTESTPLSSRRKQSVKKTKSLPNNSSSDMKEDYGNSTPKVSKYSSTNGSNRLATSPNNGELLNSTVSGENYHNEMHSNEGFKNNYTPKKHSKTPGRERKAKFTKRIAAKTSSFKGTAFQFSSPIQNSSVLPVSNVWSENRASFSFVVAQTAKNNSVPVAKNSSEHEFSPSYHNNDFSNKNYPFRQTSNDTADHHSEHFNSPSRRNVNDLGPIGTRKSPSSTPIWESLAQTLHKPTPTTNTPKEMISLTNDNSYFSGSFPQFDPNFSADFMTTFGNLPNNMRHSPNHDLSMHRPLNNNNNQNRRMMHNSSSISAMDNLLMDTQYRSRMIDTNSLLISLLQQQHQEESSINQMNGWNSSNLWGPVNYENIAPRSTITNGWPQGSIRPPPGLEPTQQNRDNRQMNENVTNEGINSMPAFDPFRSLSSIWDQDTWNTGSSTRNNQQQ